GGLMGRQVFGVVATVGVDSRSHMHHLALGRMRVVAMAAIVAVAAGILLLAGGQRGSTPTAANHHSQRAAPLPKQGLVVVDTVQRTVHTVALPPGLGGGDVGGGFGWAASSRGVIQLNQRTGGVITTLPVPGGTMDVLYADGKLWATPRTTASPYNKRL